MPGPFRSLWDGSNPLQGAVPGLVLEVQVLPTMSVRPQIIENGSKWVENRRFGLKIGPNESHGRSGPIRTTPDAKSGKKKSCEPPPVVRHVIFANLPHEPEFNRQATSSDDGLNSDI